MEHIWVTGPLGVPFKSLDPFLVLSIPRLRLMLLGRARRSLEGAVEL